MKNFYRAFFALCLLLLFLLAALDFAIPSSAFFASRLSKYPDKWKLELSDTDKTHFRETDETGKAKLLEFIEQNKYSYLSKIGLVATGLLVASIFSLAGWIRESQKPPTGPED